MTEPETKWPRVWIHKLDQSGVVPTHALIKYEPNDGEHDEFIRIDEVKALLRKAMTDLQVPFCAAPLVVLTGLIKEK